MSVAQARPGLVLATTAVAAGIAVPIAVWRWMVAHHTLFGDISLRVPGMGTLQLDARWAYALIGLAVVVSYSALAGTFLILTRRARRPLRNAVTLFMLPVFLALAWLSIGGRR